MKQSSDPPMPGTLLARLSEFRGRWWRMKSGEALAAGSVGVLALLGLAYAARHWWGAPEWARVLVPVAGFAWMAGCLVHGIARRAWCCRGEEETARWIARHAPGAGGRLLGAVEIRRIPDETMSAALRDAALKRVAEEMEACDFREVVPWGKSAVFGWVAAVPAMAALLCYAAMPGKRVGENNVRQGNATTVPIVEKSSPDKNEPAVTNTEIPMRREIFPDAEEIPVPVSPSGDLPEEFREAFEQYRRGMSGH